MNVISLLEFLLSVPTLTLYLLISTIDNSYWLIKEIHCFIIIDNIIFSFTFFWQIKPHVFNIDRNTQSLSLNNSQKLPTPLSNTLYQNDGGSKLSINMICEAKVLRALVNEYLSSATGSELLLLNKFVWITGGHFVTVISLDDNELVIMNGPAITSINNFKVDMKLTKTMAWRWSCSDKKDRNKKTT